MTPEEKLSEILHDVPTEKVTEYLATLPKPPRILGEGRITFEAYLDTHFPDEGIKCEWDTLPERVKGNWKRIEQAVIDAYEGSPARTAMLPVHKAE